MSAKRSTKRNKLITSMDFISGTSRLIAASTPALNVMVDMLQFPQAPTNSNCTTMIFGDLIDLYITTIRFEVRPDGIQGKLQFFLLSSSTVLIRLLIQLFSFV